jgi:curli biogenesis system outer membrane secretion channel CsgG
MKRTLLAMVAFLCLAMIPAVADGTSAAAAVPRKAAVCPSFKAAGVKLEWSVVGTGWTCSSAKKWVSKLVGEKVAKSDVKVTFTDGPKGFHCQGASDASGHTTVGACYKGTAAFPKSGFQWFG